MSQPVAENAFSPALGLWPGQRPSLPYSTKGPGSEDVFGKGIGVDGEGAKRLSWIHVTSTSTADALRLEGLLR